MLSDSSVLKYREKIKTVENLIPLIKTRPRDRKVIMCHGSFDIVHPGHIRHLLFAKSKGDILIASITSDAHISKANIRPYVPEDLRAINLAAFDMVDYVIIDREATPLNNLRKIQPDYFVKGYEYIEGSIHPKTSEELEVVESYGGEIIFSPGDIVYSSSKLIENYPPKISAEKLMVLMEGEGLSFNDLRDSINKLKNVTVHVIGDTIIDSFSHCSMIGGMVKTPTISVRYDRKDRFVGGAGIVAKHLKAAGASVTFSTVLGADEQKAFVLEDIQKAGINISPIIDTTRPTTEKNAIIVGNYRLLKIDTVDNRSISEKITQQLVHNIKNIPADAVVFSDFRHGIFAKDTLATLTNAIPNNAFKVADSQVASRWGNILDFKGFDLITPNEREARFSLGDQDSVIRPLGTELYRQAECKVLILKVGERGAFVFRDTDPDNYRAFFTIDSFADQVVDPVGAGDALLAYATLAMVATKNETIAAILGCLAAAVECEKDGNIPVTPEDILMKINNIEKLVLYQFRDVA